MKTTQEYMEEANKMVAELEKIRGIEFNQEAKKYAKVEWDALNAPEPNSAEEQAGEFVQSYASLMPEFTRDTYDSGASMEWVKDCLDEEDARDCLCVTIAEDLELADEEATEQENEDDE